MNLINKDTFRDIKKSYSRFLSILLIVALGVFIFIGLITTGTIMRDSLDKLVKEQNYEDIMITSSLEFENKDIRLIESLDNIEELEYAYDQDLSVKGDVLLIKLTNMPFKINMPIIREGRPPKAGEIILDRVLKEKGYKIGQTIKFNKEVNKFSLEDEDKEDKLNSYEFKIVGFFDSAQNIMKDFRGYSLRGLGSLDGLAYIDAEDFNMDPTIARIILTSTKGLKTSSQEYKDQVEEARKDLDILFKQRPKERLYGIKTDIEDEIESGEDKIDDAEERLVKGKDDLENAKDKLSKAKKDYASGESELESKTSDARSKLDEAKNKLYKSKSDLESGEKELADADEKLKKGRSDLDQAKVDIAKGQDQYLEGKSKYDQGLGELKSGKTQIDEGEKQLREGRDELEKGWAKIDESKKKINAGQKEIEENDKKIKDGQEKINQAIDQLAGSLSMTTSDLNQLEDKINELDSQLAQAKSLLSSYQEVNSSIEQAKAGIDQLNAAKAQVDQAIALKQTELQDPNLSKEDKARINAEISAMQAKSSELDLQIKDLNNKLQIANASKASLDQAVSRLPADMRSLDAVNAYQAKIKEARSGIRQIRDSSKELEVGKAKLDQSKEQLEDAKKQIAEAEEKAQEGEYKYRENKAKIDQAKEKYEKGKAELEDSKIKLDEANQKLKKARNDYDKGEKEYQENYGKYLESKGKLESGKDQYEAGLKTYQESEEEFDKEYKSARGKLDDAKNKLYKGERDLAKGEKEYQDKSIEANQEISDAKIKLDDARRIMRILKEPIYSISPRYLNFALNNYYDFSDRVDSLSLVFPVFFFLIALLVSFTSMTRMVDEQRITIGTYKALGYENSKIARKYFNYGALASIIGGLIGSILGSYILPNIIANAYFTGTILENQISIRFFPIRMILSILVGLLFTAFAALLAAKKLLKEDTANLLRVKAPTSGNRIFLERISPIWNRMSFLHKVTARNLFRYKGRMVMTVIGVMGCMSLLILGFGLKRSINGIELIQYESLQKYNLAVSYDQEIDTEAYESYRQDVDNLKIDYGKFYQENFKVKFPAIDQDLTLIIPEDSKELPDYFLLRDRKTKEKIDLPKRGAVITAKLAELKDLKVGDSIEIIDIEDKIHTVEIAAICEMCNGHYLFMNKDYYEKLFGYEFNSNTDFMKLNLDKSDRQKLAAKFTENKAVLSSFDTENAKNIMNKFMYSISKIELIVIVASSTLAVVVLYSLTNINIEERKRELSTIKVLGFYPKEMTMYVYRESFVLTLLGILIGIFVGSILHHSVLKIVEPNVMMFDSSIGIETFIIAGLITFVVSLLVMVIFHKKLKNIDMIESLKSNE